MKESRLERFKKAELMGCFNGTGVASTNYKEHLYGMEWISVKDQLPSKGDEVLTFYEDYFNVASILYFDDENRPHFISGSYVFDHVTHWMPLPEPPKE